MKKNKLITVIATLAVAAFASIQGPCCHADDDPLPIFIWENTLPGPILHVCSPEQSPISIGFNSFLSSVSIRFKANMDNVLVEVQNIETGEVVWSVPNGRQGTVSRVFVSGDAGLYRIVITPQGNTGYLSQFVIE